MRKWKLLLLICCIAVYSTGAFALESTVDLNKYIGLPDTTLIHFYDSSIGWPYGDVTVTLGYLRDPIPDSWNGFPNRNYHRSAGGSYVYFTNGYDNGRYAHVTTTVVDPPIGNELPTDTAKPDDAAADPVNDTTPPTEDTATGDSAADDNATGTTVTDTVPPTDTAFTGDAANIVPETALDDISGNNYIDDHQQPSGWNTSSLTDGSNDQPVPEPGTFAMFGSAIIGWASWRVARRRKK